MGLGPECGSCSWYDAGWCYNCDTPDRETEPWFPACQFYERDPLEPPAPGEFHYPGFHDIRNFSND